MASDEEMGVEILALGARAPPFHCCDVGVGQG